MKKRLLSLIMAVMMVVVLVVPAAAATTDTNEPATVTVYITEGLFDEGGFANGAPRQQAYIKDGEPDASDWMTQLPFDEEFTSLHSWIAACTALLIPTPKKIRTPMYWMQLLLRSC